MNWYMLASICPLLLLGYQIVIDWVNLFPWNDIRVKTVRERTLETALNYAPLLLITWAFASPTAAKAWWGMIGSLLYLVGHLNAWWRPYLLGATAKEQAEYDRLFRHTYKLLPPIRNNPIPDAEHMLLGALTLLMCGCAIIAYTRLRG